MHTTLFVVARELVGVVYASSARRLELFAKSKRLKSEQRYNHAMHLFLCNNLL